MCIKTVLFIFFKKAERKHSIYEFPTTRIADTGANKQLIQ